jgi:hypothetical protein
MRVGRTSDEELGRASPGCPSWFRGFAGRQCPGMGVEEKKIRKTMRKDTYDGSHHAYKNRGGFSAAYRQKCLPEWSSPSILVPGFTNPVATNACP